MVLVISTVCLLAAPVALAAVPLAATTTTAVVSSGTAAAGVGTAAVLEGAGAFAAEVALTTTAGGAPVATAIVAAATNPIGWFVLGAGAAADGCAVSCDCRPLHAGSPSFGTCPRRRLVVSSSATSCGTRLCAPTTRRRWC